MQSAPHAAGSAVEKQTDKAKDEEKPKKEKSHKGMVLGAAGGLAAGGLIAHKLR